VEVLFNLLGLLTWGAAIMAAVRPELLKNRKTGAVPKRWTAFLQCFIAGTVLIGVAAFFAPDKAEDQSLTAQEAESPEAEQAPEPANEEPASVAETPQEEAPPYTYAEASTEALAAARQFIQDVEKAMQDAATVLRYGDVPGARRVKDRLVNLDERGKGLFGATWAPLSSCRWVATEAIGLWDAHLGIVALGLGAELRPGKNLEAVYDTEGDLVSTEALVPGISIEKRYAEYFAKTRASCLEDADPATPPKEGRECLITYGLDPETKKVVALPRPEHCENQGQ